MKKLIGLIALIGFGIMSANAAEVAGVKLPNTIMLPEAGTELMLNGAGVRKKFFFKIYVGALYTTVKAASTTAVLNLTGPNRVAMYILYDEVGKQKLIDGWNDGFANNHNDEQMAALQSRLNDFNALFETVKEGETILLDYVPGKGTTVTINDETQGQIPGKDFNDALLRVWLGDDPADQNLKDGMLGNE